MIDIYIIITITSLFVLVVTLFFTDYQIRTLYITQQESKGDVVMENIKEDKYEIKTDETDELQTQTGELQTRNTLLEKNINGIFVNSDLVNEDKKCVDISSKKRGAFQYLELSNLQKCNDIFTYEPINKQLFVKTNESTKCITSLNDNDIILNDCIKSFDKQQFDYFPTQAPPLDVRVRQTPPPWLQSWCWYPNLT